MYAFPRGGNKYLGAAHGLIGIVYILMKAMELIPSLKVNINAQKCMRNTLELIKA